MSVDYMFSKGAVRFYGETAVSASKAMATLNGLQIQPVSYASFLLLYRNYNKRYQAFYANALSRNSLVQNEEGVYMGMQFTPFPYWKLSAYLDLYRFPWLKYGVDAPSSGKEYMMEAIYTSGRRTSFSLRYRYRQTEKNEKPDNSLHIGQTEQHRLRLQATHTAGDWSLRTVLDGAGYDKKIPRMDKGWMLGQNIAFQPGQGKLKGDIYAAYFHTDNSLVTISSFEKSPLYVYYRPLFYGQGLRFALSFQYGISQHLALAMKLASTHYMDRDKIGTELEEIEGSDKTDLNITLRCKF